VGFTAAALMTFVNVDTIVSAINSSDRNVRMQILALLAAVPRVCVLSSLDVPSLKRELMKDMVVLRACITILGNLKEVGGLVWAGVGWWVGLGEVFGIVPGLKALGGCCNLGVCLGVGMEGNHRGFAASRVGSRSLPAAPMWTPSWLSAVSGMPSLWQSLSCWTGTGVTQVRIPGHAPLASYT
jgi:hypothetical protein